jgi:hypothetical protein
MMNSSRARRQDVSNMFICIASSWTYV